MPLHLITTCSRSKAVPAGHTVFPYAVSDPAVDLAAWHDTVALAPVSGEMDTLYRGLHNARARASADRHPDVELWFVSAGLGLRHTTDPAVGYEASFHNLAYPASRQWSGLTNHPPLPGRQPSLASLMQSCPDDRYVIAASPVYLAAIENDILTGAGALQDASRQLVIVTSKGYQGPLATWIYLSYAGMLAALNTNRTALNISYAGQLIDDMLAVSSTRAAA